VPQGIKELKHILELIQTVLPNNKEKNECERECEWDVYHELSFISIKSINVYMHINIVHPSDEVTQYINSLHRNPSILNTIESIARERGIPIVGPLVGRMLFILASCIRAKRILEIGTAIGYSAVWLGFAVKRHKGKVITIEIDSSRAEEARSNVYSAGLSEYVEVIVGDARDVIPTLTGRFDMVFIDDSKENYPLYFELCYPRLRKNGLIVADNALWKGEVINSSSKQGESIARFNSMLISSSELGSIILPIRDGIAIGLKI